MKQCNLIYTKNLASYMQKNDSPFLTRIPDIYEKWDLNKFKTENLHELLFKRYIKFRVGKKGKEDIQWETKCEYITATISEFTEWVTNTTDSTADASSKKAKFSNKLLAYSHDEYWCYADYKYMHKLFDKCPDVLQKIDWSDFGIVGKNGFDSTLWVGSKGAYTICHYDTYGYNLVIQISGKKRWIMFPPTDSDYMYPTRLPYEESSVFSSVNIQKPNIKKHPRFTSATPYIVELKEGDMLYVPRHWWHYVENLETSVSINMWIPHRTDDHARLEESLVRYFMASFLNKSQVDKSVNPTEDKDDVLSCDQALSFLNQSIPKCKQEQNNCHNISNQNNGSHNQLEIFYIQPCKLSDCSNIISMSTPGDCSKNDTKIVLKDDVLKALTHPEVIALISSKLLKQK